MTPVDRSGVSPDVHDNIAHGEPIVSAEPRLHGTPLLLLLDIDGTLCDLVATPDAATVPEPTREILRQLCRTPNVYLVFITGRSVADVERITGIAGVHVCGNHGMEIARPDGSIEIDAAALASEAAMREVSAALAETVEAIPGAVLEDKRYTLSLHYRKALGAAGQLRAAAHVLAAKYGMQVTEGSCVIELRPLHASDKGHAVLRVVGELVGKFDAAAAQASILFAGDDLTDEDAFRALRTYVPHAVTVNVGGRIGDTAAEYRVRNPEEFTNVLRRLLTLRAERAA